MIFIAGSALAQDIIYKRDGSVIEALITERTNNDILYRRYNYQNGPIFQVELYDLDSIIYANGDIEVFMREDEIESGYDQYANYEPAIIKDNCSRYYYLGERISTRDMVYLFQSKCPEAYRYYKNSQEEEIWGACLTGAGLVMLGFGIALPYMGVFDPLGASLLLTFGTISTVTGIPLWAIGSVDRRNAYMVFNKYYKAQKSVVNFTVQRSSNGFGLAMNF